MSSYVDEDTARAVDAGRETAVNVLASVQQELKKVFLVFVAVFLATILALRWWVWEYLENMTKSHLAETVEENYRIIAVTPFDVILMQIKVGLIIGALAGVVVALYLARKNILSRVEQSIEITAPRLYGFAIVAALLAMLGMVYAYTLFFPLMFKVLAEQAFGAGASPNYDIVAFTQFLLLLTLSFGLAAQLPLLMGLLAYTEIVPYETFRDKWRYAVLGIFVFGAVFSPPDPFTQILWAIPLMTLYAFSLGVAKIVTNVHRAGSGSGPVDPGTFRRKGYQVVGAAVLSFVGTVLALATGFAIPLGEAVLGPLPDAISFGEYYTLALPTHVLPDTGPVDWLVAGFQVTLVIGGVVLLYHLVDVLRMPVVPKQFSPTAGDPAELDLRHLDAGGVRAAPPEAFEALDEDEALEIAGEAMEAGDEEKGKLVLQRWEEIDQQGGEDDADEAEEEIDFETADAEAVKTAPLAAFADLTEEEAIDLAGEAMEDGDDEKGTAILQRWEEADEMAAADDEAAGDEEDDVWEEGLLAGTTAGVLDAMTAEERDEDDIGGYLYDIGFILDSLRSRMFVIFGTFIATFLATFAYLYTRGIDDIITQFIKRVPTEEFDPSVTPESGVDVLIARHPVEVLIFIVKFSGVLALIVTLPLLLYYVWPALQQRNLAPGSGDRRGFLLWGGLLIVGTFVGAAIGFFGLAPYVISYLVTDALQNGMVISYRVKSFLWVIFFMTIGMGLLFNIPFGMLLLHTVGLVRFDTFRRWWRQTVLGIFIAAMFLTPSGVLTMVIFAIPIALAYLLGLGALWAWTAPATLASAISERLQAVRR